MASNASAFSGSSASAPGVSAEHLELIQDSSIKLWKSAPFRLVLLLGGGRLLLFVFYKAAVSKV